MIRYSSLLCFGFGFLCCNNSIAQAKKVNSDSIATALFKTGCSFYNTDSEKCITYLDSAQNLYEKVGSKKGVALCLQTIGFVYEEKEHNPKQAIKYIQYSASVSGQIKDTLREANMLKYLGMLQGEIGNFDEAKNNVQKAILKFNSKNYAPGVAVCYFDMAHIYESQKMYDSCIYFTNKAKAYWSDKNVIDRLFSLNNYLLHIYLSINKIDETFAIFQENSKYPLKGIYWQDRLDFFKYSEELFNKKGDKQLSDNYNLKYVSLSDSLKKQNIIIKP